LVSNANIKKDAQDFKKNPVKICPFD